MTNADLYLKDGINKENFYEELSKAFYGEYVENDRLRLKNFFEKEAKPNLSEVEKIILINLKDNGEFLIREGGGIWVITKDESKGIFSNLFKFIKERRKI